jgi:hypothetical protein
VVCVSINLESKESNPFSTLLGCVLSQKGLYREHLDEDSSMSKTNKANHLQRSYYDVHLAALLYLLLVFILLLCHLALFATCFVIKI